MASSTTIVVERGPLEGYAEELDDRRATIVFSDAVARVEREPAQALFRFSSEPTLDALVHPYLAPVAGLFAHWRGYEAFHAVRSSWTAARGARGRSRCREELDARATRPRRDPDRRRRPARDRRDRRAGRPRAIDLRDEPARRLGVGEPLGIVGTRSRWRFRVHAVPPSVPLRGWVFLEWGEGEAPSVESVSARERLERLERNG